VEVNGKTYTEMHIDGGVIAPIFLPPSVFIPAHTALQKELKNKGKST